MPGLDYAATELEFIARNLRQAGEDDLYRELQQSIAGAVRPVLGEIRAGLGEYMPDRYAGVLTGGLRLTTSRRLSAASTGVTVVARAGTRKLRRLESGVLEHPVFGDRKKWGRQVAPGGGMRAGFFTTPIRRSAAAIRQQIVEAMDRVSLKASGK